MCVGVRACVWGVCMPACMRVGVCACVRGWGVGGWAGGCACVHACESGVCACGRVGVHVTIIPLLWTSALLQS